MEKNWCVCGGHIGFAGNEEMDAVGAYISTHIIFRSIQKVSRIVVLKII